MGSRGLRLAILALLTFLGLPAQTTADEVEERVDFEELRKERRAVASRHPVNRRVSRYLAAAAEEVDEGKPDEAERVLLKLRPNRLNPLERALVYRLLAVIAYGAEHHENAIGYFEKVLEQEALPIRDESRIRFNVAQILAGLERWADAITWLKRWLVYEENPNPLGYYLMGIAYYQLEQIDDSITSTRKAIDVTPDAREPWLRLLSALYSQKGDYASATPVLEELVVRFPKKKYWVQLSLIYGAREDYETSLAVQQVAYSQGLLSEDKELRRLARSYLYRDLPHPAARVLERGLEEGAIVSDPDAYELLANSWIAAREYDLSLPPLREAAQLSEGGKLYVRLGQVHMQREEWSEASEMLELALEKGELEQLGNAELLLGICYYNDERPSRARSYFVRARQHDSTRVEAERWITHLATEANSEPG